MSNFQHRYRNFDYDNKFQVNSFIDNIIGRYTVREFINQPINPLLFEKLMAAAQSAPTSSMAQSWSVLVIRDPNKKQKFLESADRHFGLRPNKKLFNIEIDHQSDSKSDPGNDTAITTCDILLIWLADMSNLKTIFSSPGLESQPLVEVQKPDAIESLESMHYELRSIIDTTIAAQTFALAAESAGLGIMYCGSFRTIDLKEAFNLPDHVMPLFGMCVGYHIKPSNIKPRLPQHLVVHNESYKHTTIEQLKGYNETLKKWAKRYVSYDWFDRLITRTQPQPTNIHYKKLAEKYGFKFK